MPSRPPLKQTPIEFLNSFPPLLCRAMPVRVAGRGMGRNPRIYRVKEIVERSGLTVRTVERYLWRTSWEGIDCDVASAFIVGCGVNIFSKEEREYLAKLCDRGWPHIPPSHRDRINEALGLK